MSTETPPQDGQKRATVAGQQQPITPSPVPEVDPNDPPEEFADALEADEFIIYGKASIEKFDDGGQNSDVREVLDLSPDVVDDALDRFFGSEKAPGIISIGHDDIPVGRPLEQHTLDDDIAIEVDGETFEFEAGETLTTHVEDGDGDGRPELWMLGDLAKDTEIARKVRLAVLLGDLDGFSVTFGRKAAEPEGQGRRVTDWDLFSVTLAPDDMVANKGAEFDLAAFKAEYSAVPTTTADDATTGTLLNVAEDLVGELSQTMTDNDPDIDEDTLLRRLGQKLTGGDEDDESTDTPDDESGQKEDGENPVDDLITALADEMGVDEDSLRAAIEQAANGHDDEMEDKDDEEEMDDVEQNTDDEDADADDGATVEIDFGEKADEHGLVDEATLNERLESFRETVVDDIGEKVAEANQETVEEIAQKTNAGATPSPAGGSFHDEQDFESQLEELADGEGW